VFPGDQQKPRHHTDRHAIWELYRSICGYRVFLCETSPAVPLCYTQIVRENGTRRCVSTSSRDATAPPPAAARQHIDFSLWPVIARAIVYPFGRILTRIHRHVVHLLLEPKREKTLQFHPHLFSLIYRKCMVYRIPHPRKWCGGREHIYIHPQIHTRLSVYLSLVCVRVD
jgi:hypothetical protein